jgi:hypothetical protein
MPAVVEVRTFYFYVCDDLIKLIGTTALLRSDCRDTVVGCIQRLACSLQPVLLRKSLGTNWMFVPLRVALVRQSEPFTPGDCFLLTSDLSHASKCTLVSDLQRQSAV